MIAIDREIQRLQEEIKLKHGDDNSYLAPNATDILKSITGGKDSPNKELLDVFKDKFLNLLTKKINLEFSLMAPPEYPDFITVDKKHTIEWIFSSELRNKDTKLLICVQKITKTEIEFDALIHAKGEKPRQFGEIGWLKMDLNTTVRENVEDISEHMGVEIGNAIFQEGFKTSFWELLANKINSRK
jgi:hypothetical protein